MSKIARTVVISPLSVKPDGLGIAGDLPIINAARVSILYWDFIDIPEHPSVRMPLVDEVVEFLRFEGAGSSFHYGEGPFSSTSFNDCARALHNRMQESRTGEGTASLVQSLGNLDHLNSFITRLLGLDQQLQSRKETVELAILNALPAPPPGTAFSDILAFKRARADQLQLLWEAIDEMAVQFSGADNIQDATELASKKVSAALSEIDRVVKEAWPQRLLRHISTNLNSSIQTGIIGGATTYLAGLDVPTAVGTLGGAILPIISATVRETVSYSSAVSDSSKPFIFAYDSTRDFYRPITGM